MAKKNENPPVKPIKPEPVAPQADAVPAVAAIPDVVAADAVAPVIEAPSGGVTVPEKPQRHYLVEVPGGGAKSVTADSVEDAIRQINGASGDLKGRVYTAKQLKITEVA